MQKKVTKEENEYCWNVDLATPQMFYQVAAQRENDRAGVLIFFKK